MRFIPLIFFVLPIFATVRCYFNDLTYKEGVLGTENGGLVFFDSLQLQAKTISYDEKKGKLEAEGDLFFLLNGQEFVAEKLYIDTINETGYFIDLCSKVSSLFIKTQKVLLNKDRSICFDKLVITPFEAPPLLLTFETQEGRITKTKQLEAKNIKGQAFGLPVFYLPSVEWDLKQYPSSKVRYRIQYNTSQYPQISLKYPIFVSKDHKLITRLDYRIAKGFGFAAQSDSFLNEKKIHFSTNNFVDYDTFYNDNFPNRLFTRYRFQGKFDSTPKNENLSFYFKYDVNSDRDLRQNFFSPQFELNDVTVTQGILRFKNDFVNNSVTVRPKANTYESLSQQLPCFKVELKPICYKNTYFDNQFDFAYLDYKFSKNIQLPSLDFYAARLKTNQKIDTTFNTRFIKWNPYGSFEGIYYSDSPQNTPNFFWAIHYGLLSSMKLQKSFERVEHILTPYVQYDGWSVPPSSLTDHYIFSIDDGKNSLQQIKIGFQQTFFLNQTNQTLSWDLFGLNFFNQSTFNVPFPKIRSDLEYSGSYFQIKNRFGYNLQKNSLDLLTFQGGYTFSKKLAIYLDWLYRGPYEWKKLEKENYQLDVTYPIDTLAQSPLSDRRSTLISRLEWHFLPNWTFRFQHHNGFLRKDQPPYFEFFSEIGTIYRSCLDIRLSVMRSVNDTQVLFSLNLL